MPRSCQSIFLSALTLACAIVGSRAVAQDLEPEVAQSIEPQFANTYMVGNLPVWRIQDDQRIFDPTVLIAHLRNYVAAETHIIPAAEHQAIVVVASKSEHDVVHRALAPLTAFSGDAAISLQNKMLNAKVSTQKVLIFVADPNSLVVKRFFDLQFSSEHRRLEDSLRNYVIQCISAQHRDLLTKLGIDIPLGQDATLAVLNDAAGISAQTTFADLDSHAHGLEAALADFLESHRPAFPDAHDCLMAGYDQAIREKKRVLLLLSGPNCRPCIELASFLEAQRELVTKDYVCVKLDTRMPHVSELVKQFRSGAEDSIPWMAILSADGRALATSEGPAGNIGFPRNKQSKAHLQQMLSSTSQRITKEELAAITDGLGPTVELGKAPAP